MTFRRCATALAVLLTATLPWPSTALAKPPNPETNTHAAPGDDAGYFLGYPSPTYSWHGCTKFSAMATPEPLDEGVPAAAKGNKQKKVTWTLEQPSAASAGYTLTWRVADGWKICGAEIALRGRKADADYDVAMSAGYTSKATRGSTVKSGDETIKVELSKRDCQEMGIDKEYAGDWSIDAIYHVTVFIKKKK